MRGKNKILLASFGESTDVIYQTIRKIDNIKQIFLVTTKDMEKYVKEVEDTIKKFKIKCKPIYASSKSLSIALKNALEDEDLEHCLKEVWHSVQKKNNGKYELIGNITGGTKVLSIVVYLISSFFQSKIIYLYRENDDCKYIDLPLANSLFELFSKKPKRRIEILEAVKDKPKTTKEIMRITKSKSSTLHDQLKILTKYGLLENINKKYITSDFGKLALLVYQKKFFEGD